MEKAERRPEISDLGAGEALVEEALALNEWLRKELLHKNERIAELTREQADLLEERAANQRELGEAVAAAHKISAEWINAEARIAALESALREAEKELMDFADAFWGDNEERKRADPTLVKIRTVLQGEAS